MDSAKAKLLIVDTTAFINNIQFHSIGETIITIPEVIAEVRNRRQYRRLFSLTSDVELRDVFTESISHVTEFAKKTGDYAALSATDLKLIALTYQLEVENVGRDHLRDSPAIAKYDVNKKKGVIHDNEPNALILPLNIDKVKKKYPHDRRVSENEENNQPFENFDSCEDENINSDDESEYETPNGSSSEDEFISGEFDAGDEFCHGIEDEENEFYGNEDEENGEVNDFITGTEDEEDESGWITPSNFKELKRTSNKCSVEEKSVVVGCLSTDFAIQNVLLQMGLNVVTIDGKIIKHLRTYVLRCYACFHVTPNMRKTFCPKCGNKTLKRVSVMIDKDGNKRMFINFKKPLTARGKRFSLPLPQGGKHAVNPRLVEDARRPHQKPSKLARTKTNALDEDYLAGSSPFVMRDVYSKSAQHGFNRGKFVYKYWMQKNPNEPKRRPKK